MPRRPPPAPPTTPPGTRRGRPARGPASRTPLAYRAAIHAAATSSVHRAHAGDHRACARHHEGLTEPERLDVGLQRATGLTAGEHDARGRSWR